MPLEFFDLREGHDFVELAQDLGARHTQDGPVQEYVFPPGELRLEAGPHLEQRTDAAVYHRAATRRRDHTRQDLEQRAFARAIASNDADDVPLADVERDVAQRPDVMRFGGFGPPASA
jgi:hypothetical protein